MSGGRGSRLILARIHCSLCNRLLHIRLGTGVMVPQVSELCEGIYHWKAYMGILGSNTFHTEATVHLLAPYSPCAIKVLSDFSFESVLFK